MVPVFWIAVIIPSLWLAYTAKALWAARKEWMAFPPDTKAFYLLVAPPLSLALDVLLISDRLLYHPRRVTRMAPLLALATFTASMSEAAAVAPDRKPADERFYAVEQDVPGGPVEERPRLDLSPAEATVLQYRDPADPAPNAECQDDRVVC
jgi:hypothetical protein